MGLGTPWRQVRRSAAVQVDKVLADEVGVGHIRDNSQRSAAVRAEGNGYREGAL